MTTIHRSRIGLLAGAALALGACASHSDAFERADRVAAAREADEASAHQVVCPVVVSNATDHQLHAGYALQGEESVLGMIPAGRSLAFRVRCTAERIEAFATAPNTGFLGGPEEYRTVAALDRTRETRVRFTLTDRIR